MRDSRVRTLAHKLVSFSCNVQSGENVLIENYDENADELVLALIEEVRLRVRRHSGITLVCEVRIVGED